MNILDIIQFGIIAIGVIGLAFYIIGTVQRWKSGRDSRKNKV